MHFQFSICLLLPDLEVLSAVRYRLVVRTIRSHLAGSVELRASARACDFDFNQLPSHHRQGIARESIIVLRILSLLLAALSFGGRTTASSE